MHVIVYHPPLHYHRFRLKRGAIAHRECFAIACGFYILLNKTMDIFKNQLSPLLVMRESCFV
ncbi:hypothetical protein [Cylindrospermopsis raciborskii]|uniref:hypothetical protein n=1 Tax=Cylindrospermopsis raciborskii TaxID=77022 RepID=UPI0038D160DD